jgi:hypothetical protein
MTTTQTPNTAIWTNPSLNPQHIILINRLMDLKLLAAGLEQDEDGQLRSTLDAEGRFEHDAIVAATDCYWKPENYTADQIRIQRMFYMVADRGFRDVSYIHWMRRAGEGLAAA